MQTDNLSKIVNLRHELHMHPELSMEEKMTATRIKDFLGRNTKLSIVDRGGWFYAVKRGKTGKIRIAFRADMDALPIAEDETLSYHSQTAGVSHKCGHDGHCAALCGLALELDGRETEADIYLIFQPGEETGSGAVLCRELIKEEGIQRIFAFHNLSGYPEGSIVYRPGLTQPASEGLKICFHGKTSHASAPEDGNNPSEAVANVILRAAELSKDRSAGMLLCTVTGIRLGSGDFGISPGEAEICMTLRAEEESRMKRRGIRISYSVHDYFPETRNDEECLKAALAAAEGLALRRIPMDKMWRASEDFGWYLKECPGAIIYIGSGEWYLKECPGAIIYIGSGEEHPPLHTAEYDFNDRILETAVDLFADLSVLNAEDSV